VVLRYEDRSESEVAEMLHVTVGTVRSQTAKAMVNLRAAYPPNTPAELGQARGDGGPLDDATRIDEATR
jgi:hypothetical protein